MPNHVHIVGEPRSEDSLAKAVGRTNFRYAQHINRVRGRSGHLWQSRLFSCALDDMHAWDEGGTKGQPPWDEGTASIFLIRQRWAESR